MNSGQTKLLHLALDVIGWEKLKAATEGPWTVGGDGADIFGPGTPPGYADSRHIADCQDVPGLLGMETQDVADAALIALAPDMLPSWVGSQLSWIVDQSEDRGTVKVKELVIDAADALLAARRPTTAEEVMWLHIACNLCGLGKLEVDEARRLLA